MPLLKCYVCKRRTEGSTQACLYIPARASTAGAGGTTLTACQPGSRGSQGCSETLQQPPCMSGLLEVKAGSCGWACPRRRRLQHHRVLGRWCGGWIKGNGGLRGLEAAGSPSSLAKVDHHGFRPHVYSLLVCFYFIYILLSHVDLV